MDQKKWKKAAWTLFWIYCAVMLWLLFDRDRGTAGMGYWEQVRQNLNLQPFRTIGNYWNILTNKDYYLDKWGAYSIYRYYARHSAINILGNVALFIPLGVFLPLLWRKMRKWWKTWLTTLVIMTGVEVLQLFTLTGSCDVDDLILNLLGAALGYGLFCVMRRAHADI